MNKYPELDLNTIRAISQLRSEPELLETAECPYPDWVKSAILSWIALPGLVDIDFEGAAGIDLELETKTVYLKLKEYGDKLSPSDAAAYNTYFRTSAALLEKLLDMNAKSQMLTEWKKYVQMVLDFLGDHCSPDQRNEFSERLQSLGGSYG